jgi:two-component system chemotaxis response regulator CheY
MQGTTGIEVLEAVRRGEKTRNIPFVMITAEAQLFHILKAFRAEVNQYLVKPFSFEQFEYIIKKF